MRIQPVFVPVEPRPEFRGCYTAAAHLTDLSSKPPSLLMLTELVTATSASISTTLRLNGATFEEHHRPDTGSASSEYQGDITDHGDGALNKTSNNVLDFTGNKFSFI